MNISDPHDGERFAAVDLGSNSFHMVVARWDDDHARLIDRLREPVRLASGLLPDGGLDKMVQQRALGALGRFAERIQHLPEAQVRAVGTNALRQASRGDDFLRAAEDVLGHEIEVISGQEEARLIHLGVMRSAHPPGENCLVLDIGGGSTEIILGTPRHVQHAHSLEMGCVGFTRTWFEDARITRKSMKRATKAAREHLRPHARQYREGWEHALGASGTFRAAIACGARQGWGEPDRLTRDGLVSLMDAVIDAGHADALLSLGISSSRAPVFAAGLSICRALFDVFDIEVLRRAEGALREGVLHDLIGRATDRDAREATVHRLMQRYAVDPAQAARVESTALRLLEQCFASWRLPAVQARQYLSWAARLHEIGLAVSHDGYQGHGAYLLKHSHLPGFSREAQSLLATLVGRHRASLREDAVARLPERRQATAIRLVALLRLAVALHRSRAPEMLPSLGITAKRDAIDLGLPEGWLDARPLTRRLLTDDVDRLAAHGLTLTFA